MFIVTNREVSDKGKSGVNQFGKKPNPEGALELRVAEAVRRSKGWNVHILPDEITEEMEMRKEVGIEKKRKGKIYSGEYVGRKLLARINPPRAKEQDIEGRAGKGRNLLLFVHGFNNNVKAVLDRARNLEILYGVEVLAFSWPANGGGAIGVASYKSDKRDAKASTGALDRVLEAMQNMLGQFNKTYIEKVRKDALAKFEGDAEGQERYISRLSGDGCPFTVNALFHSMGNYLYKHLLISESSLGRGLLFDNVVLAAADANNEGHAGWVDNIDCRNRVYITINEDDGALKAARMKAGKEQKARLGHYPYELDSRRGVYVQFTKQKAVGDAHAYFEGDPARKNPKIKRFFREALNGKRAEERLDYQPATNMYLFK